MMSASPNAPPSWPSAPPLQPTVWIRALTRITNSEHKTKLKDKFKRICEKSMINKRHLLLTEEILKKNPNICSYKAPSLDARMEIVVVEVSKMAKEAAVKAIEEWRQPKSKITHLVFCTSAGVDMPGADCHLTKLLDLKLSVKRHMIYQQGCFAGGTALRTAEDLAENNQGARVLVVCCESTILTFHGPVESYPDNLVGQALFSDGAVTAIVGSDPIPGIERPLFELVSAGQTIIPNSEGAIGGRICDAGLLFYLRQDIPDLISENIENNVVEALQPLGISDWNSVFWIVHPGRPTIVDQVEAKLGLKPEKLHASRHVLAEYGNMFGASVLFILDEMRKKSAEEGLRTTGDGVGLGRALRVRARSQNRDCSPP